VSTKESTRREFEFELPVGYIDQSGTNHRTVVMRKMTGREEAILADKKYQRNGGKLVTELLHSCLVRLGTLEPNGRSPITSMTSADRNYLLLKLRGITFGTELETTYSCPNCGERIQLTEDLDELPVRNLAEGEDGREIAIDLEDGWVDREGQVHTALRLRLPTGADEEAVAPQMRDNASVGKNALLARCIISLGDVPAYRIEGMGPRIMSELTMTDRRLIDRALNEATPGIDLVRPMECLDCGKQFNASLDLSNFLAMA
jgi:DNA-directed RNA polymerase subunit RPC12/RpoP